MSRLVYLAAALLFVPSTAFAQIIFEDGTAPPPKAAPAKAATKAKGAKSDLETVVCRKEDSLRSRLDRHMVCLTKDQWFTYEQAYKDWAESMQALGGIGPVQ